jgi:hypothetical protein
VRTIVQKTLLQGALLLGVQATAHAGPILLVQNGVLMGAEAIDVGGQQYDVLFSDAIPQDENLVFGSYAESFAASNALNRQVFQGIYDLSPQLTNGCRNPVTCFVVTAFDTDGIFVNGAAFANTASRYLDKTISYNMLVGGSRSTLVTYASWSVHQGRQAVPEPSTLLLAGAGLGALFLRRKARGSVA